MPEAWNYSTMFRDQQKKFNHTLETMEYYDESMSMSAENLQPLSWEERRARQGGDKVVAKVVYEGGTQRKYVPKIRGITQTEESASFVRADTTRREFMCQQEENWKGTDWQSVWAKNQ